MRFYLNILFLLLSIQTFGQQFSLKEVKVRDANNTDLITSSSFVDKDRFIWYSTNKDECFYRFDGKNQLKYTFEKSKNYSSYRTSNRAWIQDHNNNIWIIKKNNAFVIYPKKLKVENIPLPTELLGYTSSVALDRSGNLWISNASRYLIKISPDRKLTKISHPVLENKKGPIEIIKTLNDGRIIAKSEYDLFYIDKKGLHFFGNLKTIDKDINPNFLIFDNGKIVKKNSSGFYTYNNVPYKYVFLSLLNIQVLNTPFKNPPLSLGWEEDNTILYADSKLFVSENKKLIINEVDAAKNKITTVKTFEFKEPIALNFNQHHPSLLWISTSDKLYKLLITPNYFRQILQFSDKNVSARNILSDSKKNLFIGTYDGLYKLEEGQKEPIKLINGIFDSMILENDSILWSSNGYANFGRTNLKTRKRKDFLLPDRCELYFLKEKSPDEFWLGTTLGLYVFNKKTKIIKPYKDTEEIENSPIYDLLTTKKGTIWIATFDGLFFKEKKGNFVNYSFKNKSFNYKEILTLHEDSNGNLWMGTRENGVVFIDTETNHIKNYPTGSGLSSLTVCGILESKDALWFATYFGLSRFDKKKKTFSNYHTEDGLSNNEFNLRSAYKKNDSTYYFGGLSGIIEFNPKKIDYDKIYRDRIFLFSTEYYSKNQNKNVTNYFDIDKKTIELPYHKNYFSASFVINELFYAENNTFYYMIEGKHEDWINMGSSGQIRFDGLEPGNYTLRVKGKNAKGIETSNEIKIKLHVEQIFYKTSLFIGFALLVFIVVTSYIFKRKTRRQKAIFETEKKILERESEIKELKANALRAQMNPHFVFNVLNNMQSVLILKGIHEANRYFIAFSKLLRITLDMSKQEFVTLEDELEYISNYILLNNMQLDNTLDYSITLNNIKNSSDILLPGMLIQPFVENAIIHGLSTRKEKKIEITCSVEDGYLITVIKDNGIGRAASALLGANKKKKYKSWATSIVNDRIKIMNDTIKNTAQLEIMDLEENGKPSGTMVIMKYKLQNKQN